MKTSLQLWNHAEQHSSGLYCDGGVRCSKFTVAVFLPHAGSGVLYELKKGTLYVEMTSVR